MTSAVSTGGGDGLAVLGNFDVVVVGAGVVGAAIGRVLSHLDLSLAVVDAAEDVGSGTSKANTAILHTGFDATPGTLESRLVARGYQLLSEYAEQTGIPVERTGALLVAWDDEQHHALPALVEKAEENGYHDCAPISAEEVYRQVPRLGPGALGGVAVPGESIICPWTPTLAYAREAVGNGATLLLGHEVLGVDVGHEHTTVHTAGGAITTRWLVNAAGLGADVLDRMLGNSRFTVTPRRGELLVFDKLARPMTPKIVLPVPSKAGKGVLVSPTVYGNVMLGPTAEDLDDKTATETSEEGFAFLRRKGIDLMPDLFAEEVTAAYAGLRAAVDHGDYLVDLDDAQRYVLVAGIRSTGLTASLALAEHVVDLLRAGGMKTEEKNERVAPPQMPYIGESQPRPYQRPDLITRDAAYGEVVCFCERVTAGEIRDALTGPVPARDRGGLSRRTRATNGRCQGFYCGAEVQRRIEQATGGQG